MRLRCQKKYEPTPGRVRTRINIEIECNVSDVNRSRPQIEGAIVRLLCASGYDVHSFIFEPLMSRSDREYTKKLLDSLNVVPEVTVP